MIYCQLEPLANAAKPSDSLNTQLFGDSLFTKANSIETSNLRLLGGNQLVTGGFPIKSK